MELIEFAEKQGEEAAKFSLATLEVARARCHQFLVLLLGGAGALTGLGLAQMPLHGWVAAAALVVAAWWFGVAAWVAMRGLRSSQVSAWTHEGATVVKMEKEWQRYNAELIQEGQPAVDVMTELRLATLIDMQVSAEGYRTASTCAARALDQAYRVTALITPLLLAIVVWLAAYFG